MKRGLRKGNIGENRKRKGRKHFHVQEKKTEFWEKRERSQEQGGRAKREPDFCRVGIILIQVRVRLTSNDFNT